LTAGNDWLRSVIREARGAEEPPADPPAATSDFDAGTHDEQTDPLKPNAAMNALIRAWRDDHPPAA
jgi:hypothetical protein